MSTYGVISGPYFPVFGLNMEIYKFTLVMIWALEFNLFCKNATNDCPKVTITIRISRKHLTGLTHKTERACENF